MEKTSETKDKESLFKEKLESLFDDFYLSNFQRTMVMTFIKKHMGEQTDSAFDHARGWLLSKINKSAPTPSEGQEGCPDIIPGLRGSPFW